MKRVFLFMLISLVLLSGCGGKATSGEQLTRLEQLKQAYEEAGFEIGDNEELAYDMLYANNGFKFTVDGELIEIYEYNMDNLSDEAKDLLKTTDKEYINFSGFNVPVKFKDGLMLLRFDEHSKKDKIVEIFENF